MRMRTGAADEKREINSWGESRQVRLCVMPYARLLMVQLSCAAPTRCKTACFSGQAAGETLPAPVGIKKSDDVGALVVGFDVARPIASVRRSRLGPRFAAKNLDVQKITANQTTDSPPQSPGAVRRFDLNSQKSRGKVTKSSGNSHLHSHSYILQPSIARRVSTGRKWLVASSSIGI